MKSLKICKTLLVALLAQNCLAESPIKNYVKVAVGPTWNQIIAVNHFESQPGNLASKITLLGLDNPCAFIQATFKSNLHDFWFGKIIIEEVAGNRGYFSNVGAQQVAPFANLNNDDGLLNTNVVGVILLAGADWNIKDEVTLSTSIGYNYVQGNRTFDFSQSNAGFKIADFFNGGGFQIAAKVHPSEKTSVQVFYDFFIGRLTARLVTFPIETLTRFNAPLFTNNSLTVEFMYHFDDSTSTYISTAWFVGQNLKTITAKAPPSVNAVMSNQFVPTFRTQYFSIVLGVRYNF